MNMYFYTFLPTTQHRIHCHDNLAVLKLQCNFIHVIKIAHHKADIVAYILAVLFLLYKWSYGYHQKAFYFKALDLCILHSSG